MKYYNKCANELRQEMKPSEQYQLDIIHYSQYRVSSIEYRLQPEPYIAQRDTEQLT